MYAELLASVLNINLRNWYLDYPMTFEVHLLLAVTHPPWYLGALKKKKLTNIIIITIIVIIVIIIIS